MHKRKIVLALHMLGQGGTDRVACLLATGYAKRGFDTTLLVFCSGGLATAALRELIGDQVKMVFLGGKFGSRPVDLVKNIGKCIAFFAKEKPDIVVSTGNNMNWVTAVAVWFSGIKTKLVMKTTNPILRAKDGFFKKTIRKSGYKLAFSYADKVLPLSDAERSQLIAAFPQARSKFQTAINPYVTTDMLEQSKDASPFPGAKIILGVGRFQPQKRFDLLIEAFALVDDADAKLVILGDGPDKIACEKLAEKLGITDRVFFPGFVADVGKWYKIASVFVMTSNYEGLPAVVLEALAGNCPVLATDCFPAARELLTPLENCKILEPQSAVHIAKEIEASLTHPHTGDLRRAGEKYSIENGIESHIMATL